jgi:hypothetical protein
MTTVVNLRVAPYDVYIGRPGHGKAGPLGNPVAVGKRCPICGARHTKAGDTLPCYAEYLRRRCATDAPFAALVRSLRGKVLGCFCKPNPCHGDELVRYLADEETR